MANLPKIALGAWAWGNDGTFGNSLTAESLKPIFDTAMANGLNVWDAPKWTEELAKYFEGKDNVPMIGVSNHNLAEIKEADAILKSHFICKILAPMRMKLC